MSIQFNETYYPDGSKSVRVSGIDGRLVKITVEADGTCWRQTTPYWEDQLGRRHLAKGGIRYRWFKTYGAAIEQTNAYAKRVQHLVKRERAEQARVEVVRGI